jgi:hypothetical protein
MSTYEFAFACDLKSNLSQEIIDTLKYMTRSEEYEFETNLKHNLFTSSWEEGSFADPAENEGEFDDEFGDEFTFLADWRTLISNIPNYGEELLSGLCGSILRDSKLNVRRFVGDDEFNNSFIQLMEWLVSICESTGFVGYYSYMSNMEIGGDPTLIYFEHGQVFEKTVSGELKELCTSD